MASTSSTHHQERAFVSGLTHAASSLWTAVVSEDEAVPSSSVPAVDSSSWTHQSGETWTRHEPTLEPSQERRSSLEYSPARSEKVEELLRTYRENSPQKTHSQPSSRRNSVDDGMPRKTHSTASSPEPRTSRRGREFARPPLEDGVISHVVDHQLRSNAVSSSSRRSSVSGEERLRTSNLIDQAQNDEVVLKLSRRLRKLEESNRELHEEQQQSLDRERQMQRALQGRDEKIQKLIDQNEELSLAQNGYNQWQAERERLRAELNEAEKSKRDLENQIARLKQNYHDSVSQLEELNVNSNKNQQSVDAYGKELRKYKDQVQNLEEERVTLESKLRVTESKNTVLERDLKKAESANANLQKVLEEQMQASDKQETVKNLEEKITSLEKRLRDVEEEREAYRQRALDLEHRLRSSETELADLKKNSEGRSNQNSGQNESMYQKISQERALKIARLQDHVRSLEQELDRAKKAQAFLDEDTINKKVVSQLVVAYFKGVTDSKQTLQALASMLDMTEEDKEDIGLLPPKLPKFWDDYEDEQAGKASNAAEKALEKNSGDISGSASKFVDAFIHYLMQESNEVDGEDESGTNGNSDSAKTSSQSSTAKTSSQSDTSTSAASSEAVPQSTGGDNVDTSTVAES